MEVKRDLLSGGPQKTRLLEQLGSAIFDCHAMLASDSLGPAAGKASRNPLQMGALLNESIQPLISFLNRNNLEDVPIGWRHRIRRLMDQFCSQVVLTLGQTPGGRSLEDSTSRLESARVRIGEIDSKFLSQFEKGLPRGKDLERMILDNESLSVAEAHLDELLGFVEHDPRTEALEVEMMPFYSSPLSSILLAARASGIESSHLLYEIGSGDGKTGTLLSLLTGCRAVLVEYQKQIHESAERMIERNGLDRCKAVNADARTVDFSDGDAFYLFKPFGGGIHSEIEERLRLLHMRKPLIVVSILTELSWAKPTYEEGELKVYRLEP